MWRISILSLAFACNTDVIVSKVRVDADSDGYTEEVDCDDAHATVNPDAPELCDGVDNNCDDLIDEDASDAATWYADADGDDYGDVDASTTACDQPDATSSDNTDCDDTDATIFPGADETCNGADEDCDDEIDEDAIDQLTRYLDADGDSYGDINNAVTSCEVLDGYVEDDSDCDDASAAIHPGAAEPDCTDPTDYDCDGTVAWADDDLDGVAACDDCDDEDPARSPLLPEICDGAVDEDCDDLVDEDDPDLTDASTWYRDADADAWGDAGVSTTACTAPAGFVATGGDCDDLDASSSPSLTELCDDADLDEDCSGAADDADAGTLASTFTTFARDADSDGYGDPLRTVTRCDAPAGYGLDATDCDDSDDGIHPTATELCDGVDQDCDGAKDEGFDSDSDGLADCFDSELCDDLDNDGDGLIDDADDDVTGTSAWYLDDDGDRYGDASALINACDQPSGTVADSEDCDDSRSAVYPGAPETCDDTDDDCDGSIDEDPIDPTEWYVDDDADGYAGTAFSACDMPTGGSASATDCDDADEDISPAGLEVCDDGLDQDCSGADERCPADPEMSEPDAFATITGTSVYNPANDLAGVGDVNGDGADDLFVVQEYAYTTTIYQGAGLLFLGPLSGSYLATDADAQLLGENAHDRLRETARAGDVDGDGYDDLAVGSYLGDPKGYTNNEGGAWVEYGPVSGSLSLTSADAEIYGGADNRYVGRWIEGLGDLDEDGYEDLGIGGGGSGSPTNDYFSIFYGPLSKSKAVLSGDVVITGATTTDGMGIGAGNADFDGDGTPDLVIGAPYNDDGAGGAGAAYVVSGPLSSGAVTSMDERTWIGATLNEYVGYLVASPGDLDGDGYDEIVIHNYLDYKVFLIYGQLSLPASGKITGVYDAVFTTTGSPNIADVASGAGDVDGDGDDELLVSDRADDTWGSNYGQVGIFDAPLGSLSTTDGETVIYGSSTNARLTMGRGVGDLSGDGLPDVCVGVPGYGSNVGAFWLFEL